MCIRIKLNIRIRYSSENLGGNGQKRFILIRLFQRHSSSNSVTALPRNVLFLPILETCNKTANNSVTDSRPSSYILSTLLRQAEANSHSYNPNINTNNTNGELVYDGDFNWITQQFSSPEKFQYFFLNPHAHPICSIHGNIIFIFFDLFKKYKVYFID